MSIGIYKIENVNTGKIYIGQSVHIETRWKEHCRTSKTLIDKAIQLEGKNNFTFSILEECDVSQLDEREQYYIAKYNTIYPNGYNVTSGGNSQNENFTKYSPEVLNNIILDLKETTLSFREISEKYHLDLSMIYYLNRGDYHTQENETYPLRQVQDMSKKKYYCIDCGKEISKGSTRCSACDHKNQQVCERPSRDILKDMIRAESFVQIGKMYNVTDNTIRKWCKSYNLPSRKKDITPLSNEEWLKI